MMQHEVLNDVLAQIPPVKRPARVSDQELAETYLSVRKSIAARNRGEKGTIRGWKDLKKKLAGEG